MNDKDKMDEMLDRILAFKPAPEVKGKKAEQTQPKAIKEKADPKKR